MSISKRNDILCKKSESNKLNQHVFWTMIPLDLGHRQCRIKEKQVNWRKTHNIADLLVGICTKTRKHWSKKEHISALSTATISSQRLLEYLSCFSERWSAIFWGSMSTSLRTKTHQTPHESYWRLIVLEDMSSLLILQGMSSTCRKCE